MIDEEEDDDDEEDEQKREACCVTAFVGDVTPDLAPNAGDATDAGD